MFDDPHDTDEEAAPPRRKEKETLTNSIPTSEGGGYNFSAHDPSTDFTEAVADAEALDQDQLDEILALLTPAPTKMKPAKKKKQQVPREPMEVASERESDSSADQDWWRDENAIQTNLSKDMPQRKDVEAVMSSPTEEPPKRPQTQNARKRISKPAIAHSEGRQSALSASGYNFAASCEEFPGDLPDKSLQGSGKKLDMPTFSWVNGGSGPIGFGRPINTKKSEDSESDQQNSESSDADWWDGDGNEAEETAEKVGSVDDVAKEQSFEANGSGQGPSSLSTSLSDPLAESVCKPKAAVPGFSLALSENSTLGTVAATPLASAAPAARPSRTHAKRTRPTTGPLVQALLVLLLLPVLLAIFLSIKGFR